MRGITINQMLVVAVSRMEASEWCIVDAPIQPHCPTAKKRDS